MHSEHKEAIKLQKKEIPDRGSGHKKVKNRDDII